MHLHVFHAQKTLPLSTRLWQIVHMCVCVCVWGGGGYFLSIFLFGVHAYCYYCYHYVSFKIVLTLQIIIIKMCTLAFSDVQSYQRGAQITAVVSDLIFNVLSGLPHLSCPIKSIRSVHSLLSA